MRILLILLSLLVLSCNSTIELPNLDQDAFAKDVNGCRSVRLSMLEELEKDKDLLKGLNQDEIANTLGKPDQNELYKRSQKFFIYNLTPTDCSKQLATTSRKYLSIRFNATGLAKEVVIYEE